MRFSIEACSVSPSIGEMSGIPLGLQVKDTFCRVMNWLHCCLINCILPSCMYIKESLINSVRVAHSIETSQSSLF